MAGLAPRVPPTATTSARAGWEDQAWIESLFGHLKAEWPYLLRIADPAVLRAKLARGAGSYNAVRLHAGIGYVAPDDEHAGRVRPSAKPERPASRRPVSDASPTIATAFAPTRSETRRCRLIQPGCVTRTQKRVSHVLDAAWNYDSGKQIPVSILDESGDEAKPRQRVVPDQ
ncbi:MAG TPA: integrase core domain-containing protein, partial [bacterium]|nr:integrase core domain-containing protein [bacterium]